MAPLARLAALAGSLQSAALAAEASTSFTCGDLKSVYKSAGCCGMPSKAAGFQAVPDKEQSMFGENPCHGAKPTDPYFDNTDCTAEGVLEQAGANVTKGYQGGLDTGDRVPLTDDYFSAGLCPVNVHWHLGTEHYSAGEYDESGMGPSANGDTPNLDDRRLAADARLGFRCHHYDTTDPKFTTEYDWKHCVNMHVGETYEVHWPHSAAGMCGTPWQYQSPFYDGVFCVGGIISLSPLNVMNKVGVQAQVFTIVNDEEYYYADLMRGMIKGNYSGDHFGHDMAKYTGSTTGTSRNDEICSKDTPITWQVDRKCHLISASSFDKMCADMKQQRDDMSMDLHAHGSRELVDHEMAANNHHRRK